MLIAASGCAGLLIGLESTNPDGLKSMNKSFNLMRGGYAKALANLRKHALRLYGTFVFGYDGDEQKQFDEARKMIKLMKKGKFPGGPGGPGMPGAPPPPDRRR